MNLLHDSCWSRHWIFAMARSAFSKRRDARRCGYVMPPSSNHVLVMTTHCCCVNSASTWASMNLLMNWYPTPPLTKYNILWTLVLYNRLNKKIDNKPSHRFQATTKNSGFESDRSEQDRDKKKPCAEEWKDMKRPIPARATRLGWKAGGSWRAAASPTPALSKRHDHRAIPKVLEAFEGRSHSGCHHCNRFGTHLNCPHAMPDPSTSVACRSGARAKSACTEGWCLIPTPFVSAVLHWLGMLRFSQQIQQATSEQSFWHLHHDANRATRVPTTTEPQLTPQQSGSNTIWWTKRTVEPHGCWVSPSMYASKAKCIRQRS